MPIVDAFDACTQHFAISFDIFLSRFRYCYSNALDRMSCVCVSVCKCACVCVCVSALPSPPSVHLPAQLERFIASIYHRIRHALS